MRFGILTVSDRSSAGVRDDLSGPLLRELVEEQGWQVAQEGVVPDEIEEIKKTLIAWVDSRTMDVILTTGGTGFAARDVTPEATLSVIERATPGLVEAIRAESLKITSHAMLSRAAAGIRGRVLIVNFPGSPKAVRENFDVVKPVLPHAVDLLLDDPDSESGHRAV
ncbi:MAG: MogA/MoaB family molybdenum cofactor biosynthesis protein [Anaerolineales bacterium]